MTHEDYEELAERMEADAFHNVTGATAMIQLGMAFGVWPDEQRLGDVLVSTSLLPYDSRDIMDDGDTHLTDQEFRKNALSRKGVEREC